MKFPNVILNRLKLRRGALELIFVSLLALAQSLLLTSNALFNANTFAGEGDAWGVVADIYDMADNVNRRGLHLLLGDLYASDSVGVGVLTEGAPFGTLWKTAYWVMGSLFQATTAYDVLVFLSVLGTWAGMYYLLRLGVGLSIVPSVAGAALLVSSDHIYTRSYSHLSFITLGVPLATMAVAMHLARRPSTKLAALFSIGVVATISCNEYLGYFGLYVFATILIFGLLAGMIREGWRFGLTWLKPMGVSALLTVILICAAYPHMTLGRFFETAKGTKTATNVEHPNEEFWHYSTSHPFQIFTTKYKSIEANIPAALMNQVQYTEDPAEMTNRIGAPVGIAAVLVVLLALGLSAGDGVRWLIARVRGKPMAGGQKPDRMLFNVLLFLAITLVAAALASQPKKGNLSYMTLLYARMFRVGRRALLYSEIGSLVLWALFMQMWWRRVLQFTARKKWVQVAALSVGALGILGFTWYDVEGGDQRVRLLPSWPHYKTPINDTMATLPKGLTLKLPYNYPFRAVPESDYDYRTSQIYDGHPLINGAGHRQYRAAMDRAGLVSRINLLEDPLLSVLEEAGVRYVTINPGFEKGFERLIQDPRFKSHPTSGGVVLELVHTRPVVNLEVLRQKIFYPRETVYPAMSIPSDDLTKRMKPAWAPDPKGPQSMTYTKKDTHEERLFGELYFAQDPGSYRMEFAFRLPPVGGGTTTQEKPPLRVKISNTECALNQSLELKPEHIREVNGERVAVASFDADLGAVCAVCIEVTAWNEGTYIFDKVTVTQR